ncbi:capsid protein [Bacillus vallismortis]|uniref:capsid protein n=1 Tax=Bacillus vallismortis TaxID=72361 RepID=UPI000C2A6D1A|nr:capsid protein [Bacillus vallismortis]PJZ00375.1 capsid protein [Bacillus vallismortis]
MPNLNYAELYSQGLQQRFAQGLYFTELYNTPNNSRIKWVNAKTIQIPRIDVTGMTDYNREDIGTFSRQVDNSWETKTLGHDREFRTLVDPVDVDETNMAITIANITKVFNDEQKIPEMDKYMASKLYSEFQQYGGKAETTKIDETNVLGVYDELMLQMDEAEVPLEGRILYVAAPIYTILKNANQISRSLSVTNNNGNISRGVRSLDEVTVKPVPSARMRTVYDFTRGAVGDPSAVQINMILIHPNSMLAPQRYEFVSLDQPSAKTGGKYLYFERKYWDVFAIERKVPGMAFNITPATP